MYRNCIFCSRDLGRNESIESFQVGARLAFDSWRGRLWVVCPACGRWNLTPLEERWEAVEACERLFRDTRMRVQRENIGLAKLEDGTRLIRIGEALPGEIAAWRYGNALLARRQKFMVGAGVLGVFGVVWAGLAFAGVLGGAGGLLQLATLAWEYRQGQHLLCRIPADGSPTGEPLELRRFQLNGVRLTTSEGGGLALDLPNALEPVPEKSRFGATVLKSPRLVLEGDVARLVLARAMPFVNDEGATRGRLRDALRLLEDAGGAHEYLARIAARGVPVGVPHTPAFKRSIRAQTRARDERMEKRQRLRRTEALALEMALHEEAERRALEGELAALLAAWKHAEEIAAIADSL
ncbi:MAG: hypothetical protein FWJ74_08390 [Gemmatimonadota bacterium]|jgi:hypothetical protein